MPAIVQAAYGVKTVHLKTKDYTGGELRAKGAARSKGTKEDLAEAYDEGSEEESSERETANA